MRYKYSLYEVNNCNDIGCEQYSTEQDIRAVCDTNSDCKGYSMRIYDGNINFRPWCLKNESENSRIEPNNEIKTK